MKPVVLIGKGVSAKYVPASEHYQVAAISEAVRLCERCDWLGVNDVPAFEVLTAADWRKVRTLVLPTKLHVDPRARQLLPWEQAVQRIRDYPLATEIVRLHTDPGGDGEYPDLGRCWSTAESLVAFLIHKGIREFVTTGIERDTADYHPQFKPRIAKQRMHFRTNWNRLADRIAAAGGTLTRWEDWNAA